jgi:hypothetical protein
LNKMIAGSFTTLDGALSSSQALNTGRMVPCFQASANIPTVTVGGRPATVTYAGWVPDAAAGVYQVNVRLPGTGAGPFTTAAGASLTGPLTAPAQLPVTITARGRASQTGVTIWVAPVLKITGPAAGALSGTEGTAWATTGSAVTATEGTAPYQYAVSSGSLPPGLVLNAASGLLSGTPAAAAAGSYTVTVTASDSAVTPLTGSITFTLMVSGGH